MSVNKVILIGNVGQDPKVTYYDGGNCVAQLSLATTEKGYTLQNGTQVPDRTDWHNLVFRNRLGEIVDKYVHKGDKLYVEGKIRTRSYDDQKGIQRYITEIFVDNMEMLSPRGTAAPGAAAPQQNMAQGVAPAQPIAQSQATPAQGNTTDDLPF
ncbi:single-stranded DNA-binding protein [Bacteroides oleiciplenus]|uniref:Single-stranded DNA-binding protein n=2 Tax=Bacteroides oleiciplenus TaxID=626931 RepID=K9DZY3_9BACE|nr:single-stranded DNA-binding protein [Bacteroides oleiciplenus]EKU88861.1 single-stranded DNA-binding protein [Bacteroides oleiciplenus YIT 12058]RGN35858.1 single-stranded DNA-binding protein [Bacteroides oleiciplenus]